VLWSLNVSVVATEYECCGHRAWVLRSLNVSVVVTERGCCGQ